MAYPKGSYVPILKAKAGELRACGTLKASSKKAMRPIFEVPPLEWDFENEEHKNTLNDQIERVVKALSKHVGKQIKGAVDTVYLDGDSNGIPTISAILAGLRKLGTPMVPTTALGRPADHHAAVKSAAQMDGLGVCVRLEGDDFAELNDLKSDVEALLPTLGVAASDVDLVIDLGSVQDNQIVLTVAAIEQWLAALPRVGEWRTLAIAATGFPVNLVGLEGNQYHLVHRTEWELWRKIRGRALARTPSFGDYAISHPELTELDPRIMQPTASLRYTTDTSWLVYKGKSVKTTGFAQMHDICKSLVNRPEYSGKTFSTGDEWIDACAKKATGPGNLTTYRQVATNHHLEMVVSQLANLGVI